MIEFFAMGGYAWYVWPAYGAVLGALAYQMLKTYRLRCAVVRRLSQREVV